MKIRQTTVVSLEERRGWFQVGDVDGCVHVGRGLIICPGVEYELPEITGILDYAGRSIWHCPECDGFKCEDKKIVVVGNDVGTAELALIMSIWTDDITICTHGERTDWGAVATRKLHAKKIGVVEEKIAKILGVPDDGILQGFELENGDILEAVGAFVNFGTTTPGDLFKQLPLELANNRWIKVDHRMRTNIPRCYAAGDVIAYSQTQLSLAMGTGATAAIWLHRELLPDGLCLTDRGWDKRDTKQNPERKTRNMKRD